MARPKNPRVLNQSGNRKAITFKKPTQAEETKFANDLSRLFHLCKNESEQLKKLVENTADAVTAAAGKKLDQRLRPRAIVKALNKIITRMSLIPRKAKQPPYRLRAAVKALRSDIADLRDNLPGWGTKNEGDGVHGNTLLAYRLHELHEALAPYVCDAKSNVAELETLLLDWAPIIESFQNDCKKTISRKKPSTDPLQAAVCALKLNFMCFRDNIPGDLVGAAWSDYVYLAFEFGSSHGYLGNCKYPDRTSRPTLWKDLIVLRQIGAK